MNFIELQAAAMKQGLSNKDIAEALGVSSSYWCNIRDGRNWKNGVPDKYQAGHDDLIARITGEVEKPTASSVDVTESAADDDVVEPTMTTPTTTPSSGIDFASLTAEFGSITDSAGGFETNNPDLQAAVTELAEMSPVDYETVRIAKSKELGVRAKQLDAWVAAMRRELGVDDGGDGIPDDDIAKQLVDMVKGRAELVHDDKDNGYAIIEQNNHREVWALDGAGFAKWLAHEAYRSLELSVGEGNTKTVLQILSGLALFDGEEAEVWTRCAPHPEEGYVIDLCDGRWRAVHVYPGGWQVLDRSPVYFTRTNTMLPLPEPVDTGTGDIDALWKYAHILEADRPLLLSWMLEAWRPDTPFPPLEFQSEQGCGKSTSQKAIKNLVDPSKNPLRVEPKSSEDMLVGAVNGWLLSYNNISHLSPARQDLICSMSTGGGYATRKFYSNSEEVSFDITRPVIMNGISTLSTAPDLVDRTLCLELPKIDKYIREGALWASYDKDKTSIFTGLLDLFAKALVEIDGVEITNPPRMVDFAWLGSAVFKALRLDDGLFKEQYEAKRVIAATKSLESSAIAEALIRFMGLTAPRKWTGTVGGLLKVLDGYRPNHGAWVQSPKGLGDALRRIAPALRMMGIMIERDSQRHNDGYRLIIEKTKNRESENGETR